MSRRDSFVVAPLFVLFMSHGLLYYAFPDQHYAAGGGGGGWLSYLKYLLVFLALPALVRQRFDRIAGVWLAIGVGLIFVPLGLQLFWINENNLLLMQFQLAALGYFFAPYLMRYFDDPVRTQRYLFAVVGIAFVAMVGEIVLGGAFGAFSRSGFRGVGPFVNPNNTGIVVALFAVIYHHKVKRVAPNLVVGTLSAITLLMSGSKTAMAIYGLGVFLWLPMIWRVSAILVVPFGLILNAETIAELWELMELREMSLESGEIRSVHLSTLLNALGDASISGFLFGSSNQSLIDNAYLDMMSYGGLLLVSVFLGIQIASVLACVKYKLWLILFLHGLLFFSMLTTNVPRLWPTGYIYWALIGISFLKVLGAARPAINGSIQKDVLRG